VNLHFRLQLPQHDAGRIDRHRRPVALPAEVQLHQVAQPPWLRPTQHLAQQIRRLGVGQVAAVAEHAQDQGRRPAAAALQENVVVKLQGEDVRIRQRIGEGRLPATQVGDVSQRACLAEQVRRRVKSEAAGRLAIVPQRQRDAAQRRGKGQLHPRLVTVNELVATQAHKPGAGLAQGPVVLGMAIQRDAVPLQVHQGPFVPVVAVGVRQQDGVDLGPTGADGGQAGGQLARAQPDVE
jgi:hypothetical protein